MTGGEFGNCEAALTGGAGGNCEQSKKGGHLTPEMREKCIQKGREAGIKGKEWGKHGGRPKEEGEPGSAPQVVLKGLRRPAKWEPQVGHQLAAVKFIREQLRTKRIGVFTQKEDKEGEEDWKEPEENDVPHDVWILIREEGFRGRNVRTRDLRRTWARRNTIAKEVDLLELGGAGGVYKTNKRSSGKSRRGCTGSGQRTAVVVSRLPRVHEEGGEEEGKEGGEEGGEEGGKEPGKEGGKEVVRRLRGSALRPIYDEIQKTFNNWRMGGQYVDNEDFYVSGLIVL